MPTTVTHSIGTASRDYSTLQAWEDACPANLVSADQVWRGECYNDAEFTAGVTIGGTTTDATRYIELTAATGQSFQDHATVRSNALTYDQSKGVGIKITAGYSTCIDAGGLHVRISRLQLLTTAGGTAPIVSGFDVLKDCYLECRTGGRACIERLIAGSFAINVVFNARGGAWACQLVANTATLIGCTAVVPTDVVASQNAFDETGAGSSRVMQSCAIFGFVAPVGSSASWGGSSGFNATNVSSGLPGSSNQHSVTYSQVTPFTDADKDSLDLRAIASTALAGAGLYDGTNAPSDVSGYTRLNPPTIGAWELTPSGPPPDITTTTLPGGYVGVAYSQTLTYTSGTAPVSWSVTVGSLPTGLSLNSSTGLISGTPTTQQTASFTVTLTDATAQTDTQALSIEIRVVTYSGDLTTRVVQYLKALRNAAPTKTDSTTLFIKDQPNVVSGTTERADKNTQYKEYLV